MRIRIFDIGAYCISLRPPKPNNLHLLQGHQATADHFCEHRKEALHIGFAVDDLHNDREIARQTQDLGVVKMLGMAKAEWAA